MLPLPSKEEAREELKPRLITKSTMEAFGSDDMFQEQRPKTKNLEDHLQNGKELLGKMGNFFTNSVRSLTTKKNNEPETNLQTIDTEEEQNKRWVNNDKTTQLKNSIYDISKNIGDSLWSFGSKTKKIAVDSGKFIKKNVDDMMSNGKEKEKEQDEDREGLQDESDNKYNHYFTDQSIKTNTNQYKKKEEDDVHFI